MRRQQNFRLIIWISLSIDNARNTTSHNPINFVLFFINSISSNKPTKKIRKEIINIEKRFLLFSINFGNSMSKNNININKNIKLI